MSKNEKASLKRYSLKREENIKAFLKDLALQDADNVDPTYIAEYFFDRGWRRKNVEEKYNLRCMLWIEAAAIVLFIASILLLVKEFLPFFGIVI